MRSVSAYDTLITAPENGADAVRYWLVTSVTEVKRQANGTFTPASVTATAMKKVGSNPETIAPTSEVAIYKQPIPKTGALPSPQLYSAGTALVINANMAAVNFILQGKGGKQLDTATISIKEDGVGISTVVNYYAVSSSATAAPELSTFTAETAGVPTMTLSQPYLWNYEHCTKTDGTTYDTAPRLIGRMGNDGRGITSITEYYLATSAKTGVTTDRSQWAWQDKDHIPTLTSTDKYLWNYEVVSYTSGSPYVSTPVIIGVYGDKGDAADYPSFMFKKSGTKPSRPIGNSSEPDGWEDFPHGDGTWWMITATIDSSADAAIITETIGGNQYAWSEPVQVTAEDGADGNYTDYKYAAFDSDSIIDVAINQGNINPGNNWYDDPPQLSEGEYLWMTKATINGETHLPMMGDDGYWSTPVRISGEKGDTGETGPQGPDGENAITIDLTADNLIFKETDGASSRTVTLNVYNGPERVLRGFEAAKGQYTIELKNATMPSSVGSGNPLVAGKLLLVKIPHPDNYGYNFMIAYTGQGAASFDLNFDVKYQRTLTSSETYSRKIHIDVIPKASMGATPRYTEWDEVNPGETFYCGADGERWLDYTFKDDHYYICTQTHQKDSTTPAQSAASSSDHRWEAAMDGWSMIATKLLLTKQAVIEGLIAKLLQTRTEGARVEISGSEMRVFGNSACNIRIGVNENGYAVFEYYDNNGNLLYDLGPQGIHSVFVGTENRWELVHLMWIAASSVTEADLMSYPDTNTYQATLRAGVGYSDANARYKFISGTDALSGQLLDAANNGKTFNKASGQNKGNLNSPLNGWYCVAASTAGQTYYGDPAEPISVGNQPGNYRTAYFLGFQNGNLVRKLPVTFLLNN